MVDLARDVDELEFNFYALELNAHGEQLLSILHKKLALEADRIVVHRIEVPQTRSVGHGQAINAALTRIVTESKDINVLMDADSCIVARHWDVATNVMFSKTEISTFGTPYENPGEFSTGTGDIQTYKGIPNVIWMGLRPGVPWRDLDAMPMKSDCPVLHGVQAAIHGLCDGTKLLKDVGWAIPGFIHGHNLQYVTMLHTKPTKPDAIVLKNLEWDYHEEYHLFGVPFVVHQRGSSKFTFRQPQKSAPFYDAIDKYVEEIRNEASPNWEEIILEGVKHDA